VLPGIIRCHPLAYLAPSPSPGASAGTIRRTEKPRPTPPGVMARSIVSSPVDPIKDYGETIVACAARTAALPRPPPTRQHRGIYATAFTLTAKLSTRLEGTPRDTEIDACECGMSHSLEQASSPSLPPPPFPPGISWGFPVARIVFPRTELDDIRRTKKNSVNGESESQLIRSWNGCEGVTLGAV